MAALDGGELLFGRRLMRTRLRARRGITSPCPLVMSLSSVNR